MVAKARSMKAEALEVLATVKRNKAGFNKALAAATRMNRVVKVVTATHYCAMKQDKETKQWNPESADFAGADGEQGNYIAKLAKACDGKKDCSISIPADDVADCPRTGYVARYRCVAADEKAGVLLELGESGEPDEAAALAKLSSKLGSVAPEMKDNLSNKDQVISADKVMAQLEALAPKKGSTATTEVKMSPGSKDRTVKLSCSSGNAPKKVKEAVEALDKAKNEALKDGKELAQAVDTTKAKREAQATAATTDADEVKAKLSQTKRMRAAADRKAATLAAEKTDLTEKLLQAPAKEEIQASTTKEETKEEENKKEVAKAKIQKEIVQVAAQEQNAEAKVKADESKTNELEAEEEVADAKEVQAKEKAQEGSKDQQQKESPKVKKLEMQLKQAVVTVQKEGKAVQKTQLKITSSSDKSQIVSLADQVMSENKQLEVAEKSAEQVKENLKQAKAGDSRQQGASNEEEVEKANGDVGGIKAKIIALNVKKAAAPSSEQGSFDVQLARDKKILEGDEKKLEQATAQNNDKEGTQAKQAKDDAVNEVEVAKAKVAALDKKLGQTKEEISNVGGAEVVKVAGEVSQQAVTLREARNDLAKAEKAEVKALDKEDTKTGNDEQQEQKDNNKVLKAEDKVNKLKEDLQTTSHPSDVEHKANELKNAEVEEKKDIQEMAADKAKVKIDQDTVDKNTEETSEKKAKKGVRKLAKKEELPNSASVREAKATLDAANVLQKADGVQTAQVISQAVAETSNRMQALEKNDEMKVNRMKEKLGKVAEMIGTLKKQATEGNQGASKLAQMKKNIMAGLPAVPVAVLKPIKARTKEEKKAALILINGTSPDAAVCKKGESCCVIGYTDNACKQQKGEFCSTASNAEAEKWRPMLQMNTQIADAKEATLDVRWEKDKSKGLKNEGDVLRLRACGTFKKSEGHSCYPKDGVGLRFGEIFNMPAGQCLRAVDMPPSSAKMNKAVSKLIVESASSKQNEATKVDTAGKKLDQKAAKKEQAEAAIKLAVIPHAEALDDLVLQLMDMDSGDFLDESKAKALFEITGSFSFRLKK